MNINLNIKPFWAGVAVGAGVAYIIMKIWLICTLMGAFGGSCTGGLL